MRGRALLAFLLAAGLALPVAAELRRVESVGVVPIGARKGGGAVPRDAAVRAAVQAAVLRVAHSLLPEDFVPPDGGEATLPEPDAWLESQLGDDPFAYTVRFSILEDRGTRPALFGSDPGADEEYVVVAEVELDVQAIRERLAEVGALPEAPGRGVTRQVHLVIEGLRSYRPLAMLRDALQSDPGVRSVVPVEFTPESVQLEVDADRPADELVADLQRRAPEGLQIVPVEAGPDTATLLVDWSPPQPPEAVESPPRAGGG